MNKTVLNININGQKIKKSHEKSMFSLDLTNNLSNDNKRYNFLGNQEIFPSSIIDYKNKKNFVFLKINSLINQMLQILHLLLKKYSFF